MSKYFVSLMLVVFAFMSCGSDEEFLTIDEYIAANSLTTQVTPSGLHYIIKQQGTAPNPTIVSNVNINYNGFFLGGGSFDSGNDVTFGLSQLILGWQEGLQLIGSGGSITLLVPADLAYGSRGQGSIPGNTDIGFDIDLIGF